jgi:hypothetical protein
MLRNLVDDTSHVWVCGVEQWFEVCLFSQRHVPDQFNVQTNTMTVYTEAERNRKMAVKWLWNQSAGQFGIALRGIAKMLRSAMPNSLGDRF